MEAVRGKVAQVYEEMNGGVAISKEELRDAVWNSVKNDSNVVCALAQEALWANVRAFLNDHKATPEDVAQTSDQPVLPGFEDCIHLQKAYTIGRGIVPLLEMTPAEMRDVASGYRRMAVGCNAHADELYRVADWIESIG